MDFSTDHRACLVHSSRGQPCRRYSAGVMDGPPTPLHAPRLPRLAEGYYTGRAFVHWSMTIDHRASGWLDPLHHARLREALCHALVRYDVVCPVYCLMPDHGHFLLCGHSEESDQRAAVRLFRQTWNRLLAPGYRLQRQAYDHVLSESQRECTAFQSAAWYILENPVRAGLAADWAEWPYSGCLVPGWPTLDPRMPDFWPLFWRIWNRLSEPES